MAQILQSKVFIKNIKRLKKRYPNVEIDIQPLLEQLVKGETPGDQIQGLRHPVFKARAANRDAQKGESGGYRLIYYVKVKDVFVLIVIYSKTQQTDIAPKLLKQLLSDVEQEFSDSETNEDDN
jgi:mRNA-degrading endonuclease RelE of RelBE toxin-antitoxin system